MTIKIFQVNDVEWYAAETAEAAMAALKDVSDYDDEDMANFKDEGWPIELSDAEMLTETISIEVWDEPNGEMDGRVPRLERVPFRKELDRLIAAGTEFPCSFACSEY